MTPSARHRPTALVAVLCVTVAWVAACNSAGAGPAAGGGQTPAPLATLHIDVSPLPSTTPTPKPRTPGEFALDAFVERVMSGALAYHVTLKGSIFGAVNGLSIAGSMDVKGDDYAQTATYSRPTAPSSTVYVRVVGTRAWVKVDGGKWTRLPATQRSNNPFAGVSAKSDVVLLSSEKVAGRNRYHLELTGGLIIDPLLMPIANLSDTRVDRTRLEVVVDDAGTPLSGKWRMDGTGRVSGQLQGIRIDLDLVFSRVGARIVIKAP